MTLGEKIKNARINAGLTEEQMSERLGVSRHIFSSWEDDAEFPTVENLKNIAKSLGISTDYFLDDGGGNASSVTVEPVDLSKYDKKGRWNKKAEIIKARFPDAEIHTLMSEEKLSQKEHFLDDALGIFTDLPVGSFGVKKAFANLDKQFYLVEAGGEQYLVMITDEFMEIQRLARHIESRNPKKKGFGSFTVGEWKFEDCGLLG